MQKSDQLRRLWRAVWPVVKRAIFSGQLFRPQCILTKPLPDILCEYDVEIPLANGSFVTANVFRSKIADEASEAMPVVMCAHPYDNHLIPALGNTPFNGPPQQYRIIPQEGRPEFSTLTSWESPDPNYWVAAGYAVVNMNMPGYANSGGRPTLFSPQQGQAFSEAIAWVGKQPWCTGSVGLTGVSYLAISQYAVAANQTPHGVPDCLKAISPWEGVTSFYHDLFFEGGVEEQGFPVFWWFTEVKPTINCSEAEFIESEGHLPFDAAATHPFYDEYWKSKEPNLASIELPLLVCASFSDHGLHTRGSFRAFMEARSEHKWVYTHRRLKWDAYYSREALDLTREFFDRFVKGIENGFDKRPPVRLEVRASRDVIHQVREESEWPLANTQYRRLFLSAADTLLHETPQALAGSHTYDGRVGELRFEYSFTEDTEITGYMALRLWVEAIGQSFPADMAVFVAIDKLDTAGRSVRFYGSVGNQHDMVARGLLQVSRRELDPVRSTLYQPVLKSETSQLLREGEIVHVDIAILPSSTFFAAGERLHLVISPQPAVTSNPFVKCNDCNRGLHVLHVGGKYDSHLLIPVVPALS